MCNTAFLVSGYMTEVDAGLLSVMENVINYDPGNYQAIVLIFKKTSAEKDVGQFLY